MIEFALKNQSVAVAAVKAIKSGVNQTVVGVALDAGHLPITKNPLEPPEISAPSLTSFPTKPAAEAFELSGDPTPKIKKQRSPRSSNRTGAKVAKVDLSNSGNRILPLEA